MRWLGLGEKVNFLVIDLLGRSLEDLFNYCGRKFSLKTVLVIACELISRIETVHSRGKLVHRDIKPENFLMGRGRDRQTIFIIDFGLSKLFENPNTGRHVPMKKGYSLTGTARYASLNAHHGIGKLNSLFPAISPPNFPILSPIELSRRDDMFSIGYLLVYFLKGSLPWQGLHGLSAEEKYKMILQKKETTSYEELCADLPGLLCFFAFCFFNCLLLICRGVPEILSTHRIAWLQRCAKLFSFEKSFQGSVHLKRFHLR